MSATRSPSSNASTRPRRSCSSSASPPCGPARGPSGSARCTRDPKALGAGVAQRISRIPPPPLAAVHALASAGPARRRLPLLHVPRRLVQAAQEHVCSPPILCMPTELWQWWVWLGENVKQLGHHKRLGEAHKCVTTTTALNSQSFFVLTQTFHQDRDTSVCPTLKLTSKGRRKTNKVRACIGIKCWLLAYQNHCMCTRGPRPFVLA